LLLVQLMAGRDSVFAVAVIARSAGRASFFSIVLYFTNRVFFFFKPVLPGACVLGGEIPLSGLTNLSCPHSKPKSFSD